MKILSQSTILMADPNTFVCQPLNLMMGEKSGAETPLCLSSSHNPKSLPNVNPGEHFNLVKVQFPHLHMKTIILKRKGDDNFRKPHGKEL